jgi:amidase
VGENSSGLSIEHAVTRTVRDSAAILDCIAGPMPGDPVIAPPPVRPYVDEVGADPGRLRIGLLATEPGGLFTVHDDCVAAVEAAARLLEEVGHTVEPGHPAALADPQRVQQFGAVAGVGLAASLEYWAQRTGRPITQDDVEGATWALAELGRVPTGVQLATAREWLQLNSRRVQEWWGDWDLLLTPTLAHPPPPLGHFAAEPGNPFAGMLKAGAFVPFTPTFNATGQPAVSLPLHWSDEGLPIGVQLVAAYGREDLLLRVAAQLEAARPWADRWPPVRATD